MARETAEERALRLDLTELALAEGAPLIGGVPERWLQRPRFRCTNFHVADRYSVGRRGRISCIFCDLPVQQTFPEDRSGPLARTDGGLPALRTRGDANEADESHRAQYSSRPPR
jgi:hypothetical protein